ncbi:MAG: flagellin N-terminal helical domain-containing protein [Armatimonadota bacterium]
MSLKINLNTAALTAHRVLSNTDQSLGKTIERLSSGFRINSASDDPAGLVISEKLRAQVSGLEQAIRNASDAVNMVRTAEAALNEVSRLLRSMRDLAVHAANAGANDQAAIQADQAQVENAIASLNKIAAETMFGQKKLLDGSAGIKANVIGNKVISADFSYISGVNDNSQVTIQVTSAATKAVLYSRDFGEESSTIGSAGTFYINGVGISYSTDDTVAVLRAAINAVSSETGVVAIQTTAGVIDFVTKGYGHEASIAITNAGGILDGIASAAAIGQDAAARVQVNGIDISDSLWTSGNGLILKDSLGNQIVLTEVGGTATGDLGAQFQLDIGTLVFQVGAYAGQTRELNIPSVYAHDLGTDAIAGENVSTINLLTAEGAQNAILILDAAIRQISTLRASLGATQKNVFESSITSLTVAKENIAASESTIRDADMAAEVMELTRNQILEQAGVAMLAQANLTPQTLLKLLQ